ncbi:hypothetical protein [Paracoccus saliphilus]|uniref:Sulfotransferase domain-containing protein n=1 Tax=Paracoccus saliphilus TaxID=405559 RepID=A0AA45W5M1_9RHOB|nr:hypothetical protein [Paracoccus saliphilus]WCR05551.1 hypothetical protein JHX88_22100 [Paracoccus saliphilus]SIS95494.1 hypothetical protein SAMN05421772_1101 [Paracoccus saliphilus]
MRKLFLHIGFNKTGSTSLQHSLVENSDTLEEQGVLYPYERTAPFCQTKQHVPLAAAIPGRNVFWLLPSKQKTLDDAYSSFWKYIDGKEFNTLIISSESFGDLDVSDRKIEWIKKQFDGYDITIVAYIRRQDSYFLSFYQQRLRAEKRHKPFRFEDYSKTKACYFGQRIAPWRDAFGSENVIVRPCDPKFWPDGELLYDFLDVIGVKQERIKLIPPLNEGVDYRVAEFIRHINQISRHKDIPRKRIMELTMTLNRSLDREKMVLSSNQVDIVRKHFAEDNTVALEGTGISLDEFFPPVEATQKARLVPDEFLNLMQTRQARRLKTTE